MNKYLITVIVPEIEMEYDIYIPNNKKMGTIKKYILKSITKLSDNSLPENARFVDRSTGYEYGNDVYVRDAGIKNGSKIVIM